MLVHTGDLYVRVCLSGGIHHPMECLHNLGKLFGVKRTDVSAEPGNGNADGVVREERII